MTNPVQDLLNNAGTGAPTAKFDTLGRTYSGRVVSVITRQATDFATGERKVWEDGQPMQQLVITLATDERDPLDRDDVGHRSLYVKWWGSNRAELVKALDATGQGQGNRSVDVGALISATYVRDEPSKVGSPTKVIEYRYTPPNSAAVQGTLNGAPTAPAGPPDGVYGAPGSVAATTAQRPVDNYTVTSPPAAAPAPAPAAAPAGDPIATIKQLAAAGLTPAQIAGIVPGYPLEAIAVIAGMS